MWLSLIWYILVLFVCWNLICTIANLRIKCLTETRNVSVLLFKNLKSSFLHDSHIWLWGFFTLLVALAHGVTVSRAPNSVLAITKNNAGLHATDSIKVIFWCQINPGTSEPARPPALQWPFLESDTYSFLIDICQKYWHFDLLASYGPGRRCVVLGTAVWTIGFKKMVIGEPEKNIS